MQKNLKFDFSKKIVLIVGGSKGIGKELVNQYCKAGAVVYYISRSSINKKNNAHHIYSDLSDKKSLLSLEKELKNLKKIDILVNCAAKNFAKKYDKISIEEWNDVVSLNLGSIFYITKLVLNKMKLQKKGSVVNVSSIAGRHRSVVSGAHYVASKSGLIGLTKQLAFENAGYNIRVNVVCPSQTFTDMLKKTMNDKKIKQLIKNIPINRIATVHDQVWPIMFLSSDAADYINGAVLDVNGGII
jgi:3-oxoacyl-[acyl-carrier protein] reductase